jgi:tetratricopeptide (TPR) repeat protein
MVDSAAERLKLARLLERQANCEGQIGHHGAAVNSYAQAVGLRREFRKAFPAADAKLANALTELAISYQNIGRLPDALATATEALDIYGPLYYPDPGPNWRDVARAHLCCGKILLLQGRPIEAVTSFLSAFAMARKAGDEEFAAACQAGVHVAVNADPDRVGAAGVFAEAPEALSEATAHSGDSSEKRLKPTAHPDDPDEEIRVLRTAMANAGNDADRGYHQALLAVALWRRANSHASQPADLDDAITSCRECLASWPPEHPKRPTVLFTLGSVLKDRFDRDARAPDLDDAVSAGREAINGLQPGAPNKSTYGMTLGEALWARFKRDHQPADLDELIEVLQTTLAAAPADHADHQLAAGNLAIALAERASLTSQPCHVDQVLQANRYLLEILPLSNPQRAKAQLEIENILRWRRRVYPDT